MGSAWHSSSRFHRNCGIYRKFDRQYSDQIGELIKWLVVMASFATLARNDKAFKCFVGFHVVAFIEL